MQSSRCKKIYDKLNDSMLPHLRDSNYYKQHVVPALNKCLNHLDGGKIGQILCYGLGSFHNGYDVVSRYQLALLLLIHSWLSSRGEPAVDVIEVYDPSFEDLDRAVLDFFPKPKFKILDINEYCARDIASDKSSDLTLVYMPHLDKYLYNNLLGANWSVENLSRLVILGNSFQAMIDNEIASKCRTELFYMNQLVNNFEMDKDKSNKRSSLDSDKSTCDQQVRTSKALIEVGIDDSCFDHLDIFNNLSLHVINRQWLMENPRCIEKTRIANWQHASPSPLLCDWPD